MLRNINRILKLNMFGDDVRSVQEFLKKNGFYSGPINGFFNNDLMISVKKFQRAVGIDETGIINVITINRMNTYNKNKDNTSLLNNYIVPYYVDVNNFIIYKMNNDVNIDYNKEKTIKKRILITHTGGSYRPDLSVITRSITSLTKNETVIKYYSPHYIIGRKSSYNDDDVWDGIIINVYDDAYWSEFIKTKNNNFNKNTINICLCCSGPLKKLSDGVFINNFNIIVDNNDVVELTQPYKGHVYWEKYTEKQIESLKNLIYHLCKKHNIEIIKTNYDVAWFNYNVKNINSYNFIDTGGRIDKNEFGLFPQAEIIEMLNEL